MDFENITLEQPSSGIYLLTIDRPKALNALNSATLDEIAKAAQRVNADPDARVLLLTGGGEKAFVAGADISEMQEFTGIQGRDFSQRGMKAFRSLETLNVPVIGVVNGYCLGGGCELAMSCDFIVASDRAVFGQPEVNLGVTPGFGGSQRLPRLVGRAKALELLYTGRQVKAEEALQIGLICQIYAADELMEKAMAMAASIASKGPIAIRLTKEAVQRGQDLDLDNACTLESEVFGLSFSTADQKEGMKAFLEKRSAEFKNT